MSQLLTWPVIEAIERGESRVLLYGPPGTGKTRSAFNAAKKQRKPFFNVTLSDETSAAEIRGHYVPRGPGSWRWMNGPAMLAYTKGGMLVLNEIDKASQDCLDFLHGLLDDHAMAAMTLPTGRTVKPKAGFQVIGTMNGEPRDLPEALQDRFSTAIEVTEPHPDAVASLPQDLQAAAKKVETYEDQQRPATIRRWMAFSNLRDMEGVTVEDAAKAVFAHRAGELLDAIGFAASATNTTEATPGPKPEGIHVEDDGDEDALCTCDRYECRLARAKAWIEDEHGYDMDDVEPDEDDEYMCPECEKYYVDRNEATLCCFAG